MTHVDRRNFLRNAAKYTATGVALAPSLSGLIACNDAVAPAAGAAPRLRRAGLGEGGYGELIPEKRLPFLVPRGFNIREISTAGAPMAGNPGQLVPNALDGMGCFGMSDGTIRLVRNHEIRDSAANVLAPLGARPYDARAGAGTTTLEVVIDENEEPRVVREWVSLSGTMVNCAGGVTPGGSWLTCEETDDGFADGRLQPHGYVFEVPAAADGECEAVPLKAMGRFAHEAVAVDPATGIVYLTEDAGTTSGFYRFIPHDTADYTQGGVLQMLRVVGQPNFDTRNVGPAPALLPLAPVQTEWVTIPNPDPKLEFGEPRTYTQGALLGAARFARLEGAWWGDGSVFFDATSGGRQQAGQIFQYRPGSERLTLIYESPSRETLDSPDNICVSPRGGIVICEDGQAGQFIRGLTPQGHIFDFVRSLDPVDATEFAGACFSPDGKYLFFNTQGSTAALGTERGGTFAIWGPWALGAL